MTVAEFQILSFEEKISFIMNSFDLPDIDKYIKELKIHYK